MPSLHIFGLTARPSLHRSHLPFSEPAQLTITRSRHVAARSSFNDDSNEVDIDALAARLAAEANARLRREARGSSDSRDEDDVADPPSPPSEPAKQQQQQQQHEFVPTSAAEVEAILASVGDGGFTPADFELLQELGQISIQQEEESGNPLLAASQRTARAAVIAYIARYWSGMPFEDPVPTLAKEYLSSAKSVACNELQVLTHLVGMPSVAQKYAVASAPLSRSPPVVQLLGYFLAGASEAAARALQQGDPCSSNAESIWLVQRWDSMAPLALYPATQQTSGLGLGRLFGGGSAAGKERSRMLRAIAAGALRALGWVHDRWVIHGSLGSGSVLLSTFDDQSWGSLVVKLDNFGFARQIELPKGAGSFPIDADSPLALGQRGDKRQLAVVLLEAVLSALAAGGASESTSAEAVQRVLRDVFEWDVQRYRQYVADEADWEAATEVLEAENGAGWQLLSELVEGGTPASQLVEESPFCQVRR